MNLKKILIGIDGLKAKGNIDIEIKGIESNSKNIKEGDLFIAIKGFATDGHKYVNDAIAAGAKAVIVEEGCDLKSIKLPEDVTLIMAKDTRIALAKCSCNFYENPSKKFKLIGVTGTKGKTTTTFMIKEMLEKAGYKTGLIGTIATYINGKMVSESSRTTPESIELQRTFAEMVKQGTEYVVMEVSSQSLKLHRVDGCDFDIVLFTNYSEDHISEKEHPDMEDYFKSKLKLFEMCDNGIINVDDLQVSKIPAMFPNSKIMTYGIDNYCEVLAKDITITNSYVDFRVKISDRNERVKVSIPGRFSVYNSLAAICVAKKIGIPSEKVISVFGCGGDRDKGKRPLMGEISGRIADFTFITTDNPRTENPETIVNEIEEGIKKTKGKYKVVIDRKEAIAEAIKMATKLDIIILAGKGHEPYQEINGVKHPFDERIIVREIIDNQT